jgi:hypothetical protein
LGQNFTIPSDNFFDEGIKWSHITLGGTTKKQVAPPGIHLVQIEIPKIDRIGTAKLQFFLIGNRLGAVKPVSRIFHFLKWIIGAKIHLVVIEYI